jgi:2-polyprenyl-6-methoxyphenol hydroxylase-like FAD-dependent oxidoreductase
VNIYADLIVGCDGRSSTIRNAAGLIAVDLGSPIDVLWFRLTKKSSDPTDILGHLGRGRMMVTIDRSDYWQCAYVIKKGGMNAVRSAGIEAFQAAITDSVHFLSDRVHELKSFDDIKLLSVSVDRLMAWSRPGLLCIGDAAHAMSPVGGVGINLAIQDAVATANLLARGLKAGLSLDQNLDKVRRRRLWPVKIIQALQINIHARILDPLISGAPHPMSIPLPLRLLNRFAWLRRWPAQFLCVGIRPEHIRRSDA